MFPKHKFNDQEQQQQEQYAPQYEANPPPAVVDPGNNVIVDIEQQHPFPRTIFIDTLTTTKEVTVDQRTQQVDDQDAIARIEALREMRFKPHQEYADQIHSDRQHNVNDANHYQIHHGAIFLKPINGFPLRFQQTDFNSPTIKVINHKWWQKALRWATMLVTAPLSLIRSVYKSRLIEDGEFGYAKDMDGNIEIYNSGKGYQTGLSPWTNIEKSKIDADYVNMFNRVHMVKVKSGEYAMAELNGRPVILPPGRHLIESPQFTLKTKNNDGATPHYFKQTDYVIKHGNTHIIRVPEGKVARAKLNGRIVILEPEYSAYDRKFGTGLGAYVLHDQNFELLGEEIPPRLGAPANTPPETNYFQDIKQSLVDLDPARVLTVPKTKAAVVEHNGNKIFLRGGRYALPDATYVYKPQIEKKGLKGAVERHETGAPVMIDAMYDLTDQLVTISTKNDTPLMSNDKILLQIEAQLLFTVIDVEACDLKVGITDFLENTKQRARNKLYELVSKGNYLQPINTKNQPSNGAASSTREVMVYNEEFARRQITADFATQVYEELNRELDASSGIRLEKVLITSLIIQDPKVRAEVEKEATQAATANAGLSSAKIDQATAVIKAETDKRKALINASQDAEKLIIETKSKTDASVIEAETEAKNINTRANAKAGEVITLADADKKAAVLRAEGAKAFNTPATENIPAIEAIANGSHKLLEGAKVTLIGQSANEVGKMALFSEGIKSLMGQPNPTVQRTPVTLEGEVVQRAYQNNQ